MRPDPALTALSLTMLVPSLSISVATVGLPAIAVELAVGVAAVQWVVIAYLLATTTLIIGAGRLGDLFGRRRVLRGGIAVFAAATLLCGLAPDLPLLIAARALQGVGAAAMMALTIAFVGDAVPKGRTGRAMGLLGTMSAVGTALGPAVGGALLELSGWRALFLAVVPLAVAALVLSGVLPESAGERRAAPLGLSTLRTPGLVANAVVSAVVMTTLVVGPFHLGALGLAPGAVGLVMSVGPVVSALTGVPAGRATDRHGARGVALVGLAGVVAGTALLAVVPTSVVGYAVPLAVVTASYALFQAANNTAVMADVPADRRGAVSGVLTLSRNLGLMTGALALGAAFAALAGPSPTAADTTGATRWTFALASAVVAVGLAARVRSSAAGTGSSRGGRG